ncbi:beta-lactamase family protein [Bacteriovoracales bacterium]|nr:beta-lactamase family protein [Bacteriovoracales bacterium]
MFFLILHLAHEDKGFNEKESFWKRVKDNDNLDFEPGKKYKYSNLSYAMLGQILEFVSKKSLFELFQDEINKSLGIDSKELRFDYIENEDYASGYLKRWSFINFAKYFVVNSEMYSDYEDGWLKLNQHNVDYKAMGGLITNAKSVGLFLQDLLKEESKLLKPETKKLLNQVAKNNDGEEAEMTLGRHVGELGGAGFHCEMRIYPDKKIGSIVMTNSTTFDVKNFLNKVDVVF